MVEKNEEKKVDFFALAVCCSLCNWLTNKLLPVHLRTIQYGDGDGGEILIFASSLFSIDDF